MTGIWPAYDKLLTCVCLAYSIWSMCVAYTDRIEDVYFLGKKLLSRILIKGKHIYTYIIAFIDSKNTVPRLCFVEYFTI